MHNLFSTNQFSMRTHDAYKTCMKFLLNFNLSLILLYKYGKKQHNVHWMLTGFSTFLYMYRYILIICCFLALSAFVTNLILPSIHILFFAILHVSASNSIYPEFLSLIHIQMCIRDSPSEQYTGRYETYQSQRRYRYHL